MKTFDRKDVFSWSNSEEAKTYIGKTGYFNNDFEGLKRAIELDAPAVLGRVDTNSIWCFEGLGVSLCFGLFLPTDKVKEVEEKEYRPFKHYLEFTNVTEKKVGDVIIIMSKDKNYSAISVIIGKRNDNYNNTVLLIGILVLTLQKLFEDYLWKDENGYWQPFGVQE